MQQLSVVSAPVPPQSGQLSWLADMHEAKASHVVLCGKWCYCWPCLHPAVQVVTNTDLVVGDVLIVNMGDKVVADGIMVDGFHLVIDEASLTGGFALSSLWAVTDAVVCLLY